MKIHSIKYNALYNIAYTLSNIIFPLITFPYVSRILMSTGNGKVNFFSSIATYGTTVASLGISTYGIRAVAKVRDNKEELSRVTFELLLINLLGTILVLCTLGISFLFVKKFQIENGLFIVTCVTILMSFIGMNWLYSGLEQYNYITIRSIIFKLISLILVFVFVRNKSDYLNYSIIMAFSTVGSYILNFIYSKNFISVHFSFNKLNIKKHLKPTFLLFGSILAVSIYTNLDTVMLGFYSGDREVGLYTVAVKVKWLLLMLINSISAVLLPRLSKHVQEKNFSIFNRIVLQSSKVIFFISIPLSLFFVVVSHETVLIIGGKDYSNAANCMAILMPILVISGFSNITGNQILIPLGKDGAFLNAVTLGAILNVAINIIVLPKYGANGAAVATLIAEVSQMLIQSLYCRNIIKNTLPVKNIIHFLLSGTVAAGIVILYRCAFSWSPFVGLIIYGGLFFIVYGICLLILKDNFAYSLISGMSDYLKKH